MSPSPTREEREREWERQRVNKDRNRGREREREVDRNWDKDRDKEGERKRLRGRERKRVYRKRRRERRNVERVMIETRAAISRIAWYFNNRRFVLRECALCTFDCILLRDDNCHKSPHIITNGNRDASRYIPVPSARILQIVPKWSCFDKSLILKFRQFSTPQI